MKNLKLKAARAGKDLSQQALADLVGVSRQTIAAVEKGDYNPTINLCIAICRVLDKTLDDLFWEVDDTHQHQQSSYAIPQKRKKK
ncbi:helix-turn-helix transcriptional regulator [Streptococcus dysgalactiae]|nr:helix-turn-helix transcriptional regulator [Streptococcus dysgalactiae]